MKTKHTPGPWIVKDGRHTSGSPFKEITRAAPPKGGGIQGIIALLPDRCPSAAQWEPNARLIAAAPEMLSVMQFIVDNAKDVTGEGHLHLTGQMKQMLVDAIAKATGGAE